MCNWKCGWHEEHDTAFKLEQKTRQICKQQLRCMQPVSREDYVGADLPSSERNGFSAATLVIINQNRALMLLERDASGKVLLGCTGGKRNQIREDAWTCARRGTVEETGGLAHIPVSFDEGVAWQARAKRTVFICSSSNHQLAERIQDLRRPPKGVPNMLPPQGPLTAVWVPLHLLNDVKFRDQYLQREKSKTIIDAALQVMQWRAANICAGTIKLRVLCMPDDEDSAAKSPQKSSKALASPVTVELRWDDV